MPTALNAGRVAQAPTAPRAQIKAINNKPRRSGAGFWRGTPLLPHVKKADSFSLAKEADLRGGFYFGRSSAPTPGLGTVEGEASGVAWAARTSSTI